jgi:hypothetical protein
MSRKTPEMAVTASKPAPNRVFCLESEFLLTDFEEFSCGVLLLK